MADTDAPADTADDQTTDDDTTSTDTADADKWKSLARKHERENKKLADRLKEIEDRDKSELQKLQESLAERDSQIADLPRQVRAQAIRFASQATTKGFVDPEDALTFLADDIDLADKAAVDAALDELAERKPHLLRSDERRKPPTRPKPDDGAHAPDDKRPEGKARAAAALRQFSKTR